MPISTAGVPVKVIGLLPPTCIDGQRSCTEDRKLYTCTNANWVEGGKCVPCEENAIRCYCGTAGLTQYKCVSGLWVDQNVQCTYSDCPDLDIVCYFQTALVDLQQTLASAGLDLGYDFCLDWEWALAGLFGIGALVVGAALS